MIKVTRFYIAIVLFVFSVFLVNWTVQAQADRIGSTTTEDREQITNTVESYFESR